MVPDLRGLEMDVSVQYGVISICPRVGTMVGINALVTRGGNLFSLELSGRLLPKKVALEPRVLPRRKTPFVVLITGCFFYSVEFSP